MPTYERQLSELERYALGLEDRMASLSMASDKRIAAYDLYQRIDHNTWIEQTRADDLMSRCDSVLEKLNNSARKYHESVF